MTPQVPQRMWQRRVTQSCVTGFVTCFSTSAQHLCNHYFLSLLADRLNLLIIKKIKKFFLNFFFFFFFFLLTISSAMHGRRTWSNWSWLPCVRAIPDLTNLTTIKYTVHIIFLRRLILRKKPTCRKLLCAGVVTIVPVVFGLIPLISYPKLKADFDQTSIEDTSSRLLWPLVFAISFVSTFYFYFYFISIVAVRTCKPT